MDNILENSSHPPWDVLANNKNLFHFSDRDDQITIIHTVISDLILAAHTSACLGKISQRMSAHHLKLNLDKTEPSPIRWELYEVPAQCVKDMGVTLDDRSSFAANTDATTRFCRISRCYSLLADVPLDLCSSYRMQHSSWSLIYPSFPTLYRSSPLHPVAAWIRFITLVLAYRAVNSSGASYIEYIVKPYSPPP